MLDEEFFDNLRGESRPIASASSDKFDVEVESVNDLTEFQGVHRKRPAQIAFMKNIMSWNRVYKCPRNIHTGPGGCGAKCRSVGEGRWGIEEDPQVVIVYQYKD